MNARDDRRVALGEMILVALPTTLIVVGMGAVLGAIGHGMPGSGETPRWIFAMFAVFGGAGLAGLGVLWKVLWDRWRGRTRPYGALERVLILGGGSAGLLIAIVFVALSADQPAVATIMIGACVLVGLHQTGYALELARGARHGSAAGPDART